MNNTNMPLIADSTFGSYRLLCVLNNQRSFALSDKWHEYFLWKQIGRKVHISTVREPKPDGIEDFFQHKHSGWGIYLKQWYEGAEYIDDTPLSSNIYTVTTYERIESSFSAELAQLQLECEELAGKYGEESLPLKLYHEDYERQVRASQSILSSLFASKREKNEQRVASAENRLKQQLQKVAEIENEINKRFSRVNEIRAIVLG